MRVQRSPDGRVFVAIRTEFEFLSPNEARAAAEAMFAALTATPASKTPDGGTPEASGAT